MSSIIVAGDTSGTVTLQAPSVAGSTVLNLPTVSGGTLVTSNSINQVVIGDTTASSLNSDGFFVAGTGAPGNITQVRTGAAVTGVGFKQYKTRGTSATNHVALLNGDYIGLYYAYASDGTAYVQSGGSAFVVNGTVSTNIVPTAWQLSLMNTAGSLPVQLQVDAAGNLAFNSGYGSAAVAYGCRAWVNFNGTSSGTITPRASGGVTSITKNGTGDYTINLNFTMPDANYSVVGMSTNPSVVNQNLTTAPSTTAYRIYVLNNTFNPVDLTYVHAAIFR